MSASSVRDLARRHAIGELSLEEYRTKRHALIDDIVNGRQPLTYGELRPPRINAHHLLRFLQLAAAVSVVVALITVSIWMFSSHTNPVAAAQQNSTSQPEISETSPGPQLIENFLHTNNWNKDSIQDFMQQWNNLPQKEREIARKDYHYPRLISEVRQQIISQRAMSGLTKNAADAKTQLASLQDMATMLGIKPDN